MNDSIYAPPKADLSAHSDNSAGSNGDDAFYVVSLPKLTALFFCTLGMYQVFWCYKNWSNYKDMCRFSGAGDSSIWPIPRAIFSVFFVHSLFREVNAHAAARSRPLTWNIGADAAIMVGLLLLSGISGRLSSKEIGSPYTDIAWLLLLVPLYFSFRKAQININASCGDPQGLGNSKFTVANWIWIVAGSIICLLAIIGTFLPNPDA